MDFPTLATDNPGSSPLSAQPPSQRCKRGIGRTACSRCKTRKQKCDGRLPSCLNCAKSGANCDLQNIRGEDLLTAKYIRTLENRVSELELQLRQNSSPGNDPTRSRLPTGGSPGRLNVGDVVNSLGLDAPDTSANAETSQFGLYLALNLGTFATSLGTDSQNGAPNSGTTTGDDGETIEMPSHELGAKLIKAYSDRVDFRYPFLDVREMMELHQDKDSIAQVDLQYLDGSQKFKLFKLFIVYAIGSGLLALTEKPVPSSMAESFYKVAMRLILAARQSHSLESIEAIVLLVIFHLRSSITHELWYLIGIAMRTSIHLGLYLSRGELDVHPSTIQRRRKLFWTVYALERNISISLGHPVSLPDRLIDVQMPTPMQNNDEKLSLAVHLFKLRRIESRIHHSIYRNDKSLAELFPKTQSYFQQLQEWKDSLMFVVSQESDKSPDYYLLHYHRAMRLLIQPFLSILPISDPYYRVCLDSAGQICQLHKRLHQNADYGHSFIAVQTVFVSGIVMLYCLWTHTSDIWSIRLSNNIRACSSVLFVMGERTPWVRRYRDAFEALVTVTMERLEELQVEGNTGRSDHMQGSPNADSTTMMGTFDQQVPIYPVTANTESAQNQMPPPLQVLQDRWMELDTLAVINELATWVGPEIPFPQSDWVPGIGDFGNPILEEWQMP